jgi:hypothetical protein
LVRKMSVSHSAQNKTSPVLSVWRSTCILSFRRPGNCGIMAVRSLGNQRAAWLLFLNNLIMHPVTLTIYPDIQTRYKLGYIRNRLI